MSASFCERTIAQLWGLSMRNQLPSDLLHPDWLCDPLCLDREKPFYRCRARAHSHTFSAISIRGCSFHHSDQSRLNGSSDHFPSNYQHGAIFLRPTCLHMAGWKTGSLLDFCHVVLLRRNRYHHNCPNESPRCRHPNWRAKLWQIALGYYFGINLRLSVRNLRCHHAPNPLTTLLCYSVSRCSCERGCQHGLAPDLQVFCWWTRQW